MKIAIVVVSSDTEILAFFEKRKGAIVPKSLREGGFEYNIIVIEANSTDCELMGKLIHAHASHDAVGVLADTGQDNRLSSYSSAVFLKTFDASLAKVNLNNYFAHILTRWLKNLKFISKSFTDGKLVKCLLLPYQNFVATDLNSMFDCCRCSCADSSFQEQLSKVLKAIRKRSVPKKRKAVISIF